MYKEIEDKFPGKVVMSPSLRASLIYFRAEQAIISYGYQDLCRMPWIPSIKINQLWHGVPLKKIGLLRASSKTSDDYGESSRLFMRWCGKVDRFFVASDYEMEVHEKAFKIPKNRFIISGNPRNDRLFVRRMLKRLIKKGPIYPFRNRKEDDHDQESILMHPDNRKGVMDLLRNDAELTPGSLISHPEITHDEEPENELMIEFS